MTRQAIGIGLLAMAAAMGCAESATAPAIEAVDRARRDDVRIEPGHFELTAIGERIQLRIEGLDGNDRELAGPLFSWYSLDPDVATIDAMGVVEARSNGVARIIATLSERDGTELSAVITVRQTATELLARESAMTAYVGTALQLPVGARDANGIALPPHTLEWHSSDPSIAVVDRTGLLMAARAGNVRVTAARDGHEVTIRVNVEYAFVLPDAGKGQAR